MNNEKYIYFLLIAADRTRKKFFASKDGRFPDSMEPIHRAEDVICVTPDGRGILTKCRVGLPGVVFVSDIETCPCLKTGEFDAGPPDLEHVIPCPFHSPSL